MKFMQSLLVLTLLFTSTVTIFAQNTPEKTKAEIKKALGTMPSFMEAVPDNMLPMAWEHFNSSSMAGNEIPAKYLELIKLAVAAQIPCQYCIHAHEVNAKGAGATEQELKEAIMAAAWVRHWSTVVQSTTASMEEFEKEYGRIVEYLSGQTKE